MIVYVENKPYYTIKKLILQSGNIGFFSRRVTHGGNQKIEITPWFVLGQK